MNRGQHFIRIDQYTINIDRIDFIEQSEQWSTVLHFTGGRSLQLGEDSAHEFLHALEQVVDKLPSWRPGEKERE